MPLSPAGAPSEEELEAAHALENDDRVSGRPEMTAFRRRLRLHQSRWRESKGYPIGTQPIVPKPGKASRPLGSRLPVDYAEETGENFLSRKALDAARARVATKEPRQSFDRQRFWADLLWSPSMAVNLFGDLAADLRVADRAVHAWWPDAPGTVSAVRFVHSPGWFDPEYLNSLREFDAAVELDLGDGGFGIIGVDVKYHEWAKPETPRPENMPRYVEVSRRSRAFRRGAIDPLKGKSDLAVTWLEHLLVLSMLQHPSRRWRWGRYVVVHPAGNTDYAEATERYRTLLADDSTFSTLSLEEFLSSGALGRGTVKALRDRYVPERPARA
ncbi:MAG: PGN_0703 family putative restriction endonuclease [Actinomycetota bacterium]